MASLQATKRRIKSVEATKKITKAMELVSSAKLKKAKDAYEINKNVGSYVRLDFARTAYLIAKEAGLDYLIERSSQGSTLYVVIASDMGLCGGYNTNIAKEAYADSKPGDKFIIIGKKVQSFFKAKDCNIVSVHTGVTKEPDFYDMYHITQEIIDIFNKKEVDNIKLVYTRFVNSVTFKTEIYSLVPILKPDVEPNIPFDNEREPEYLLKRLMRDYINSNIYSAIIESRVCEYASSRMAMENATDNAVEIQEHLQLQYNRVRQANITQEIAEIVSGANAI